MERGTQLSASGGRLVMETPDATDDMTDITSLDCPPASDPTIPRTTSLNFTAQMERDDLLLRGAPANRADVDVAPCSQPRQIPHNHMLFCTLHPQLTCHEFI